MKKTLTLASLGLLLSLSHGSFAAITGYTGVCLGSGNYVADTTGALGSGGTWSSSNPAIVTINSAGLTHGVSVGTATITYAVGASFETYTYTVHPAPAMISGTYSMCVGTTATLTDATPGGTWSSGNTSIATINASTGVATGVSTGTVFMYYSMGSGCSTSTVDTVNSSAPAPIFGDSLVCAGSTTTLTDATFGGTWSSSNTSVATVSATGVVTGIAGGAATITYTYTTSCGTGHSMRDVFVSTTTTPGTITGPSTVSAGGNITLADVVGGGAWSSSNPLIASVNPSGVVTGLSAGTTTITYTVTGCSGSATVTTVITVTAANCISGNVLFTGTSYSGSVKVWLIKYDAITHLLTAVDSMSTYSTGTSAHYQFCGMAADTYRVKAATADSIGLVSGYVPTYHTSSFYWSAATTFYHALATTDINKDITMGAGVASSGPGFIAGDVTMGANKGTAGSIPSVGLLIYAQDNATGAIMQHTKTDAAGHYSFSNLPVGTYRIYPELINYATTPYSAITLTSAAPSMTAASFEQHTISYKITPATAAVGGVATAASFISTFPNPTSGKLNVNYEVATTEHAAVTVTDVTGRAVYSTSVELTKGAGTATIDLSAVSNGSYMISIKSASVNYNNKVQVQK